jgi:hypothetical protein
VWRGEARHLLEQIKLFMRAQGSDPFENLGNVGLFSDEISHNWAVLASQELVGTRGLIFGQAVAWVDCPDSFQLLNEF